MTGVKHLRILLLVAIASPLLAFWSSQQDPGDWAKDVERACTSPRYGLRRAAARKVAAAGAAAVPAIREFVQKKGRDAIPSVLVDMIADDPGLDALVIELLREWADDRDFYWRASAMRGRPPASNRRCEFAPAGARRSTWPPCARRSTTSAPATSTR